MNNHKIVNKLWGHEIWIENNKKYCGKHLYIMPYKKCSVHYHKNKKETFYVLEGCLSIEYSNELDKDFWLSNNFNKTILEKGQSFTIEKLTAHRFYTTSITGCNFIEFSSYHDDDDSYRIIESELC